MCLLALRQVHSGVAVYEGQHLHEPEDVDKGVAFHEDHLSPQAGLEGLPCAQRIPAPSAQRPSRASTSGSTTAAARSALESLVLWQHMEGVLSQLQAVSDLQLQVDPAADQIHRVIEPKSAGLSCL